MLGIAPTSLVAATLAKRKDLLRPDGLLDPDLYTLRCNLGVIATVDGVAIRDENNLVEAMAVVRNTGLYAGKLCNLGGVIAMGEGIEPALRRQYKADLGCEIDFITPWYRPALVSQHRNNIFGPDPNFLPEQKPHCIASVHLVRILNEKEMSFGKTDFGQEVRDIRWFSFATMPPPDEFGYGQHKVFNYCLRYYWAMRRGQILHIPF